MGEREEERGDGWTFNLRPVLSEVPLVHFWVALLVVLVHEVGWCNLTDTPPVCI